jgi:hypothetical protein
LHGKIAFFLTGFLSEFIFILFLAANYIVPNSIANLLFLGNILIFGAVSAVFFVAGLILMPLSFGMKD